MPEHFRALVLILVASSLVFALSKRQVVGYSMAESDWVRRRNLWIGVTLIAFLAHSFWIFILVAGFVLVYTSSREWNPLALYFFLLFAVPPFSAPLSGLGVFNQLLVLDYPRLLSLAILLPAAIRIATNPVAGRPFRLPDLLILGYLLTQLGLRFTVDTATNTARYTVYSILDVWLPYYVASRTLGSVAAFRDALMSFVCATIIMAVIAMFEAVRYWLPYRSLLGALGVDWSYGAYLSRGSFLRAQVTTGQPIVLGYIMVVALCVYAYIRRCVASPSMWWLGFAALLGGLIASFSRGPWMAAGAALLVFRFTTPRAVGGLLKIASGVGVLVAIVLASPLADEIVDYLPFVGSIETENVTYRQHLLEVSIKLILQHPWFGSFDYIYALASQDLVMGGMVDIVNTYIGIGLANGLVGLGCFVGAFAAVLLQMLKGMWRMHDRTEEINTVGSGLVAAIVGIMITIFTVSSISFIPHVYWTFLGLGAGYVRLLRHSEAASDELLAEPISPPPPRFGGARAGARAS